MQLWRGCASSARAHTPSRLRRDTPLTNAIARPQRGIVGEAPIMHYTFPSVCWHVCEREGKQKGCVSSSNGHTPSRLRPDTPLACALARAQRGILGDATIVNNTFPSVPEARYRHFRWRERHRLDPQQQNTCVNRMNALYFSGDHVCSSEKYCWGLPHCNSFSHGSRRYDTCIPLKWINKVVLLRRFQRQWRVLVFCVRCLLLPG